MTTETYEKLRERIDSFSIGFNATASGIEIKILQKIFTENEAQMYLFLSRQLEPIEVIASKTDKDYAEVAAILSGMLKKGLVFPRKKGGKMYYAAAPFMHGFFENQATTIMNKELATMYDEYIKGGFFPKGMALRTIPVNIALENRSQVLPYDDIKQIIESKERIGLFKCACALKMQKLETGCSRPLEVCMGFDYYAEYPIEHYGIGRWISKEEALNVLEGAEKAGLVHQTGGDSRNIECICNCCPNCCVNLNAFKAFPSPAKLAGSNYYAEINSETCLSCETCLDYCPMKAIVVVEDRVTINLDRCIGCGLCTRACPNEARRLVRKTDKTRGPLSPEKYRFMRSSLDFDKDIE
jgi:Dissimilatory sulfite reductase (desulfoviridin), alpha and beta subunits